MQRQARAGRSAGARGASEKRRGAKLPEHGAPPNPIGPRARLLGVEIVGQALSRYVIAGYDALAGVTWPALHADQTTARMALNTLYLTWQC